ncbi:MAG: dihydroorotase [Myxococcales bacterium]|nr:dihydroorotase [Myxococcales bacterium]
MTSETSGAPIILRGGRVIDPSSGHDGVGDVILDGGRVIAVEPEAASAYAKRPGAQVIEARGLVVAPGLVDLHVHLREPGHEYKEDIASGSRAAAAGGFTSICCMPNTQPPNDCRAVTDLIVRRAREAAVVRIYPVGAISQGLKGEALAEMGEMKDAGIVAVSDDGRPVMNAALMRRALEYARTFGLPVVQHCEDLDLAAEGVMNEGPVATRAGLRGQPSAAESVMVARDLELLAWTGGRYHVAHVSTVAAVRMVREAKRRGLQVTCEVTPQHLTLTDAACAGYDTDTKCAPPLRGQADLEALREALADGTIDCIATDHAPHAAQEKQLEFDHAAFGMIGLETALGLGLRLVDEKVLDLPTLIARFTVGAARVFDLPAGTLANGAAADVVVFDPAAEWTIEPATFRSKSKNSPFAGLTARGRVMLTIVGGKVVYRRESAGG